MHASSRGDVAIDVLLQNCNRCAAMAWGLGACSCSSWWELRGMVAQHC
jgi:hypothetical protein